MRWAFRLVLTWLLALALPLQGWATVPGCGAGAGHPPSHAEAAVQRGPALALGADGVEAPAGTMDDGCEAEADEAAEAARLHATTAHGCAACAAHRCVACAACGLQAAVRTEAVAVEAVVLADAFAPVATRRLAAPVAEGPERPPRRSGA